MSDLPRHLGRQTEDADNELRYNPATGSMVMPADWSPRPDDIPADRLAAILTNAVDLADGIRAGYRAGRAAPDPLVVAVLDRAIVWRREMAGTHTVDLGAKELALIAAVDLMLAARHTLRDRCTARYERPGGRESGDRIVACHRPAGHPGDHEEADTGVTWPAHRLDTPPVTPAADLADDHKRAARAEPRYSVAFNALTAALATADRFIALSEREHATIAVLAAIDALRRSQPGERTADRSAIDYLIQGLDSRGITDPGEEITARAAVKAAFGHIDRQATALDEAAQGELLEAELDGGLTAEQEIRARAIAAAVLTFEGGDQVETTVGWAADFERFITDGTEPDDDEQHPWDDAAPKVVFDEAWRLSTIDDPGCTCTAGPGEHPHGAGGCDVVDCGCTWTPPPPDAEEPIRREGSIEITGALAPASKRLLLPTPDEQNPDASPTDGSTT
jgi:hypothetical protein